MYTYHSETIVCIMETIILLTAHVLQLHALARSNQLHMLLQQELAYLLYS
jgi:hypothetical protein